MNAGGYPKRSTHFAHKLVRLMLHSCAAQEIGPDGFLVVTAIAHAEDAKRYSGPVTYWNEQLLPILGFGSWGQLDRARKRAIEAGWLHYECGGKGKVGKYWATVPSHLVESPDVSTEADHHVSLSNSGEENVKETGKKRERTEGQPGDNRGTTGEHSTLVLPLPLSLNTNTHTHAAAGEIETRPTKTEQIRCDAASRCQAWALPASCDESHRSDLAEWIASRYVEHGWLDEIRWQATVTAYQHWTGDEWRDALRKSAERGTKGIATFKRAHERVGKGERFPVVEM